MKKILLSAAFVAFCIMGANAQRMTDKLNRGLVAVKTDKGGVLQLENHSRGVLRC